VISRSYKILTQSGKSLGADIYMLLSWEHSIQIDTFNFMIPIPVCVLVLHVSGCCRAYICISGAILEKKNYNKACWWYLSNSKVGRTPACVKTCNSQDTISATWRKERSTVEVNEIMKTAAHRSESWCWHQLLSFLSHVLMLVLTQLMCGRPKGS
jgi:hypothetical protein